MARCQLRRGLRREALGDIVRQQIMRLIRRWRSKALLLHPRHNFWRSSETGHSSRAAVMRVWGPLDYIGMVSALCGVVS